MFTGLVVKRRAEQPNVFFPNNCSYVSWETLEPLLLSLQHVLGLPWSVLTVSVLERQAKAGSHRRRDTRFPKHVVETDNVIMCHTNSLVATLYKNIITGYTL